MAHLASESSITQCYAGTHTVTLNTLALSWARKQIDSIDEQMTVWPKPKKYYKLEAVDTDSGAQMYTETSVRTDLQQFEIVEVQRALGASSLHHIQVVQPLLTVSCGSTETHRERSEKSTERIKTEDRL